MTPRSPESATRKVLWLTLLAVIGVALAIALIAPGSRAAGIVESTLLTLSFPTSWVLFVPWYIGSAMIAPFADLAGGARLTEASEVAVLGALLVINVWLVYGLIRGIVLVFRRGCQAFRAP